ncbi:hypothetical protein [Streptomyces lucensis]|nr:hypothetical protein [Streptomyces lucensis]
MTQRTGSGESARESADAAVQRLDRFSTLPERTRPEDMVETSPATAPDPARDMYNADEWLIRYCG